MADHKCLGDCKTDCSVKVIDCFFRVEKYVVSLILELTHGLEMQRKLLYNARHGHVIMIVNGAWLQRKQPHP